VLTNLRLPTACGRLTVVSPSEWGTRRRAALEAGARRLVGEISVEPLALRVAGLSASTSQQQRIAVVELNSLTTTVTLTGRSGTETWIEACEYEPTIGSADLAEGRGVEAVVDVVDRLLGGRKPSYLVVVGAAEPALLDAMRAELSRRYGFGVDLRAMSGVDLVRGGPAMPTAAEPAQFAPQTPWVGSLHEHAAATAPPPKRHTPLLIGAAVVAVVVAAVAAAAVVLTRSGGESPADRATTPRPSAVASPAQPSETFGRVGAVLPAGWHITNRSGARVDISPNNGARERISLVQKDLAPGSGVEDVAATLETQIAKRPAGTVGPLQRNVIFGGRPGLSYEETPGDDTTVRWQVLVDSGLQVSVGCQYPTGDWQPIAAVCEKFVGDLRTGA